MKLLLALRNFGLFLMGVSISVLAVEAIMYVANRLP